MSEPANNVVVGKECVFVTHLPAVTGLRDDTHLIKEKWHYADGTVKPFFRVVKNYQRPFWITKPAFQNHKQKKESESLEKVTKYTSTETDLGKSVASRLGQRYVGKTHIRDVCDSPFIYGLDVRAATMIKEQYRVKYPDAISPLSICVYDTEVDTYTEEIVIATVAMKGKIKTYIHERLFDNKRDIISRLQYLYDKYIPKTPFSEGIDIEYIICKTEIDIVKESMATAHQWDPDVLAMWNASYDIEHVMAACDRAGVKHEDIFSDPSLPKELRYFKLTYGATSKLTESGKYRPYDPHEKWNRYTSASRFYIIDAMASYNYVRVGAKAVPGGYSLTNILEHELGVEYKKLTFKSDETANLYSIDWHRYMLANKPLEYVIYNQWDCLSMLVLDNKTKDLSTNVPTLSGSSTFDVFNSGPKRIVDGLHFFYLDRGKVLGSKPSRVDDDKILGLDRWIKAAA